MPKQLSNTADAIYKRRLRAAMTPEQKQAEYERKVESRRKQRERDLVGYLRKQRERERARLAAMTPEELQAYIERRRAKGRAYYQKNREACLEKGRKDQEEHKRLLRTNPAYREAHNYKRRQARARKLAEVAEYAARINETQNHRSPSNNTATELIPTS